MRTLLLADDNITVQRVIALTFAGEQIQIVTAADGQQAIEKMAARQPDIVLAGTTLPNVNGYDLARFMRGKTELQMVPVLLLAGAFDIVDEARLASCGANGIIEKPVEPTTLINRVKELLGLKSEDMPAPTGRLVTPGTAPPERTRPSPTPLRSVTPLWPATSTPLPHVHTGQDHPRDKSGPDSEPRSMADSSRKSGDYLDTLDDAFDSLDQQLSGLAPASKTPRNPAGPLGQGTGAADPRSPGRAPSTASGAAGNPVFEVDDAWFAGDDKARARRSPGQEQPAPPASTAPIDPVPQVAAVVEAPLPAERGERHSATLPPEIKLVAPEITEEILDQIASRVADRLSAGAFGEALKDRIAATMNETVRNVVTEASERLVRDTVHPVVTEASERLVRDAVHPVVTEASERMVRDTGHTVLIEVSERMVRDTVQTVVSGTSERVLRDTVPAVVIEMSERLIRETVPGVVAETSDRIVRDTAYLAATEASERLVRDTVHAVVTEASNRALGDAVPAAVAETSERLVRDMIPAVIAETSERLIRDLLPAVIAETSERLARETMPAVIAATSERLVRETVLGVVVEASERLIGERVPAAVTETSERLIRDAVPAVVAESSERVVRDTVRSVVLETSERLVREEIERIKSRAAT